ncbi:Sensory transduction histidine kinase [Lunatimonas lonarensis]|uniref:Sensory transduction histidine kinase n=2 Tax=Lunatimonas lonarensis TaxID=1232681 RepID=R7ZNP3_9BACT|nr:Sensory transduction histidine kinase [Lunatimonas lonarensis]
MIIKKKIEYGTSPLFCWDVFACDTLELRTTLKKSQDVQELKFLAEKKGWEFDWERLFDYSYQTIVLTGVDNRILWVGDGFHEMTGYPKVYALGKSPQFLQGPGTREEDKESFKEKLLGGGEFTQRILNYRKDRSEYICEVTVLPIMGVDQSTAAFLALESEVF